MYSFRANYCMVYPFFHAQTNVKKVLKLITELIVQTFNGMNVHRSRDE